MVYPLVIKKSVECLINELNKHFPGIEDMKYHANYWECNLQKRMEFALYLELVKAGYGEKLQKLTKEE